MTRTQRGRVDMPSDPATRTAIREPIVPDTTDIAVEHAQGDLLALLDEATETTLRLTERFEAFHRANPAVYEALVRLTREWVRQSGRRRIGIAAVYERARWQLSVETTEAPRLNNSYRSLYSRLIMAREPDLAGVYETRRSVADEPDRDGG